LTFPILKQTCASGIVVTEDEALHAMALAFTRLKIVLEPGGAVALAAALFHPDALSMPVAIAVATGGNVDPVIFAEALGKYG
jgi:threonine dehydratase